MLPTIAEYAQINWSLFSEMPLIRPPFPSPIIADPTFVFPDDSPDGRWHLFAHSLMGIHHFTSEDGGTWNRNEIVLRNSMRPFLFQEDSGYYLLYESIRHRGFPWQWLPGQPWASAIEIVHSTDLLSWSEPTTLLEPGQPWHKDDVNGSSLSNPCLVPFEGGYRLYFSAGLTFIPDCGFCEPSFIGVAEANHIMGPFEPRNDPIIEPDVNRKYLNLAAGAMKVLQASDGWVAFQNGIYWDSAKDQSGSAILLLSSNDGLHWIQQVGTPVLSPTSGWRRSHIYALDVRYRARENRFYLYFNARSNWHWTRGIERIGLLTGELQQTYRMGPVPGSREDR